MKRRIVALPRPKGTRKATKRAQLVLTMHPRQLADLEARAKARSMSLSGYVRALLDDDDDGPTLGPTLAGRGTVRDVLTSALAGFMFQKGADLARGPAPAGPAPRFLDWLADRECTVCGNVPGEGHAPGCTGTFPEVST